MTLFELGIVAHLIADWPMQNHWMAQNKSNLRHPAAWIHAAIHTLCLGLALGWVGGVVLGICHLLIDTRLPLHWWQHFYGQTVEGAAGYHTAIWTDQAIHITFIALWIQLFSHTTTTYF